MQIKSQNVILISKVGGVLLLLLFLGTGILKAQQLTPSMYKALHYRFIGPGGNRISAITGVPGNANVDYVGAASGGIWKTTDGGANWKPIFDNQDVQSIGALAIPKGRPHTIWAGTGESFVRSNVAIGDGIYKSTDGGKTWKHMGLTKSGRIGRIVIDPNNPKVVYACAQGKDYGPQQQRGVFRTMDGGKTWKRVLFVNKHTGCSGLTIDKNNPNILFAGMWQFHIKTWGEFSGGPGSGVFVSRDGGDHWKRLTAKNGLPKSPLGKIDVEVAPNNSNRVYALIQTGSGRKGSFFRSDDGGHHWHVVNHSRLIDERPDYFTRMMVDPDNYRTVYFMDNWMYVTRDGGNTIKQLRWGGDNHVMWADPKNPDRMMIGTDVGLFITKNRGRSWNHIILPIGQMYHVAVDRSVPYHVYSNMQDDESVMGPSDNLGGYGIPSSIWHTTAGCESGFSYPDTVSHRWVWGTCYSGEVERYDRKTGHTESVTPWPDKSLDSPPKVLKYRWNWTPPLAISPTDHNKVYVGSQYVHMTTNGGQSWKVISPNLTRDDTTHMNGSGGLNPPDNLGAFYWGTLFAIAASPVQSGVIWAGSNDGLVHVTKNGGKTWQNVTGNIPDLPPYGTVSSIDPSPFNAGTAYITVDFHQMNNRKPYIYKTTDFGKKWTKITDGIPHSVFSYVHNVKEDPNRKGLLFAGTENGIYVSFNDGKHWQPLQNNLPHVPVSWITVQPKFHDLVISTFGRGLYILDDITPLEQTSSKVLSSDAHLFNPRPAYRFRKTQKTRGSTNDHSRGRNPRYGASINYYLKNKSSKPVTIKIKNQSGQVIRKLHGSSSKGINRVWWNLRYPHTDRVKLRTTPASHPHIWEENRFRGKKTRQIHHWGIAQAERGPLVNPGKYTVQLKVGDKTMAQSLTVKKDPDTQASLNDIQEETAMWMSVYHDINHVVKMINQIERIRKQIENLPVYLTDNSDSTQIMQHAHALDQKAHAVENQLFQKYLANGVEKTYPAQLKLYLKFVWFAGEIGTGAGDVAGDPDYPPTKQQKQVFSKLSQQLNKAESDYEQLLNQTVPDFNKTVEKYGVHTIVIPNQSK